MPDDAAEEIAPLRGEAELRVAIGEGVSAAIEVPDRDMTVTSVARKALERLGHEGGAQAMFLGNRLDHELEERVLVGGGQCVVEFPVHLELAVGRLVIVLVGLPAERQHGVAY